MIDRQERVRRWLIKYTDPRPMYDGVTAWELAGKLLREIDGDGLNECGKHFIKNAHDIPTTEDIHHAA